MIKTILLVMLVLVLSGCPKNYHSVKKPPTVVILRFDVAPELKDHELNITIYPRERKDGTGSATDESGGNDIE